MVIQNACPRFSVTTLLSVIALLAHSAARHICGPICAHGKRDPDRSPYVAENNIPIKELWAVLEADTRVANEPRKAGK
jgi:hypothetical protein